jgi:Ca2+-transporting ATPase
MRTRVEIEQRFPGASEKGLTPEQASQSAREFGPNRLTPLPRAPVWKKFLEKFDDPIIKILLAAALLSMFVDLFRASAPLAGVVLGIVAVAMIGLWIARLGGWIPSLMFVSALVVFALGVGLGHPSVEGLAVMVAVILATGVAFLNEYKSDREFELLNAQKEAINVKVIRGGEFHTLPLEDVCVGDQVVLEMGDEVPADGRLIKATDLYIDQSLMTGESEPVHKKVRPADDSATGPGEPGCVYRGTQVVDGVGHLMVTEVGDATYLGQIARRLSAEEAEEEEEEEAGAEGKRIKQKLTISKEETPLQKKLGHLAELISKVGYAAAVLIFLALFIRGIFVGEVFVPTSAGDALSVAGYLLQYFVYMVIIIVVAVPEGLPMSVTVSLALAMQKMTRANSLVRQLVACETIGSATVICSDKTGTLTQNKMRVGRLFLGDSVHDRNTDNWVKPEKDASWPRDGKPLDCIVLNAAVNSTANLEEKEGRLLPVGNSTEGSLLLWLDESGVDYRGLRDQFPPLYEIHFSSERKQMTTVIRHGERLMSLIKGAPERVLAGSTHHVAADGTVQELTDDVRARVEESLRDSTSQAMRTLAFAYKELPADTPTEEDALHERKEELQTGLVFAGYVGIRDPLRDDVKDAVDQCRQAGIEVKMITGDNVETARAIAYDIGLIDSRTAPIDEEGAVVLTSRKFNELHGEWKELQQAGQLPPEKAARRDALADQLAGLRVLARAQPLDKYKMVDLLQGRGEVVAVTGDGTNDAPALKKADVGLAMGITGTEVAKEASDIVLLDDAFSTIVKACHWGRSLYENIQRFIQFQLTINVSALTIAFLGPFFGVRPPFTVLQLLWINVIMDTFAAIALCSEPPRPGLMKMPPKKKDENILTPAMKNTILATGAFFVVVMMALLWGMSGDGTPLKPGWFDNGGDWFVERGGNLDAVSRETAVALTRGEAEEGGIATRVTAFSVRQVSLFFTIYVFFQVWNQINCRSLVPEVSGFAGLFRNRAFLMIAGTIAVVQVLIVMVPGLGHIFKTEPLGLIDWAWIIVGTSSVLVFAEVARRVRLAMNKGAPA